MRSGRSTAVLVNAWTPELARHIGDHAGDADWFVPWVRPARRLAGWWTPSASNFHTVAFAASLRRTLLLRRQAGEGGRRQAAVLQGDRWLADRYARRLEARHTHLVVDQSLLVPLAQTGALGGRTYEVFVHALPADELQRRLDAAARRWPDVASHLVHQRMPQAATMSVTHASASVVVARQHMADVVVPQREFHAAAARELANGRAVDFLPAGLIRWDLRRSRSPMALFARAARACRGEREVPHLLFFAERRP